MTDTGQEPELLVYLNEELIAEITRTRGKGGGGRLRYFNEGARPLSSSMPSEVRRHGWKILGPWLEGLLPERPELLTQWRREFGIKDRSPLSLLAHVGGEVAGAARFIPPNDVERATQPGELISQNEAQIADALRLSQAAQSSSQGQFERGKFSLAGAQAKIALYMDGTGAWFKPTGNIPTTHIIKPVMPNAPGQELGEHMMMVAARALGLVCAESTVVSFEDIPTIVVKRYDRIRAETGVQRVHQEDFAQALGIPPLRKYQSQNGPGPAQIADHLRAHVPTKYAQQDVERFAQALIFNWLTVGTDAHAKNYSLLLDGSEARLAPLYDLNSIFVLGGSPTAEMSMRIGSAWVAESVRRSDWAQLAVLLRIDEDWVIREILRQAELLPLVLLESMASFPKTDRVDFRTANRLLQGVASWSIEAIHNLTLG